MFKRIHYNQEEGMVIRVKTGDESAPKVKEASPEGFPCTHKGCGFVAKTKLGLISHNRKHK